MSMDNFIESAVDLAEDKMLNQHLQIAASVDRDDTYNRYNILNNDRGDRLPPAPISSPLLDSSIQSNVSVLYDARLKEDDENTIYPNLIEEIREALKANLLVNFKALFFEENNQDNITTIYLTAGQNSNGSIVTLGHNSSMLRFHTQVVYDSSEFYAALSNMSIERIESCFSQMNRSELSEALVIAVHNIFGSLFTMQWMKI